jgi:hypothetical protein
MYVIVSDKRPCIPPYVDGIALFTPPGLVISEKKKEALIFWGSPSLRKKIKL